jgi:regulator of sigma E protease
MEFISQSVNGVVSSAVPMVVLLGMLIFIHELGHFLVAKFFGVRVETFSLGFGPKILKFQVGETVYAISLIPLGGYVKMFGDDPQMNMPAADEAYSFSHKPVSHRIAIVLAGPIMNFLFAVAILTWVSMAGEPTVAAKIGDVAEDSAAAQAGFKSGDSVVSADSKNIENWDDFLHVIEKNPERTFPVDVVHANASTTETLSVKPKLTKNKNILSWDKEVGEIDGLSFSSRAAFIGIHDSKTLAAIAGLHTGDSIVQVNGKSITTWREFKKLVDTAAGSDGVLKFRVERGYLDEAKADKPDKLDFILTIPETSRGLKTEVVLDALGIDFPEMYLAAIKKGSPADNAGLKVGDRVVEVDHAPVTTFAQVSSQVRAYGDRLPKTATDKMDILAKPHGGVAVRVIREGAPVEVSVIPELNKRTTAQGKDEKRFEIGISPMIIEAAPERVETKAASLADGLRRGFDGAVRITNQTVLSFVRLFQGEVSSSNLGGFLSIGQLAKKSWQIGWTYFINVMAVISINLFVLNLLPVPVLDGGHLVFYIIEAIKGAPLSLRKMEIAQQVGVALLLGLMVFATFNDISRIFFRH